MSAVFRPMAMPIAVSLGVLIVGGGSAVAMSPELQARSLANEGADAYARKDYERALDLLGRAYAIVPAPTIALLEGRSLARLGRLVAARDAFRRAASAPLPAGDSAAFALARRAAADELRDLEPRLGHVKVRVPDGLAASPALVVWIDGRPAPAAREGEWVELDPGPHRLQVIDGSAHSRVMRVVLAEGERRSVDLVRSPEVAESPSRTWSWLSFGLGGAGLVTGVSAGIVATSAHHEADRSCPDGCAPGSAGADAVQRFRTWRTVSTVRYITGAVGLATGVGLFVASEGERRPRLLIASGPAGIDVEGTW